MSLSEENVRNEILSLLEDAYTGRVNNLKRSINLADKALKLSRQSNDVALEGKSLNQLSLYLMIQGSHKKSQEVAEDAIRCFTILNDELGIAEAKYNIAGIYYKTDNFHLGLMNLVDCLAIYKKHNDYHFQSKVHKSLGTIYEYFGDEKNALKSYEAAIDAAKKAKDRNLESNAFNPLSGIYLKKNKIKLAMETIEKSIAIKRASADVRGLAFAIYGRGKVYAKTKQYDLAERDYLEALKTHEEMGERLGTAMALHKLGALYIEKGQLEKAKETLYTGLAHTEKYNTTIIIFRCHYLLYTIYRLENNTEKALYYLEQYLAHKERVINTQTLQVIENYELITKMELLEKENQAQKEKDEIIEKKNRAEEMARVRQEFLSTMSHEIRTPLNAVVTITSLLAPKADKEEKELLDSLKYASNNLLLLINDILDFTKLENGKVTLEKKPTNINQLLKSIQGTYESLAKDKGLRLETKLDKLLTPAYLLDNTKTSQILGNLIGNSIKFTEKGKVTVSIENISPGRETDIVRFRVSDTGIGIHQKHFEEIFESFSQPKSVTTRKHGGSGLGLAIVKKLVALYNSKIIVESTQGVGSSFYFDVLLTKAIAVEEAPLEISGKLQQKTVLLAEDNKVNAMVAMRLLKNWGLVTEHAENGLLAVEKAKQKAYDYILMDIHMPEMNGFDATRQIRTQANPNANTPIFALTADITAENQDEYSQYFSGFLLKPIEIEKLYTALVSAI